MKKIAIIGATGATGCELIKLALKDGFLSEDLLLIASEKSVGKILTINNIDFIIKPLEEIKKYHLDVIFLAAGSKVSTMFKDSHLSKSLVIDLSSVFRQDPSIPLIIPEINPESVDFKKDRWIASPNCVTTIYLMVLSSLIKKYGTLKILLSTYQAASGAGYQAMDELKKETSSYLNGTPYQHSAFKDPYSFNLFTHNAPFLNDQDNEEEIKIRQESRKILNDKTLRISATCVRVPTLRAHAISAYVMFEKPVSKENIYKMLNEQPGIKLHEDFTNNQFATPLSAACQDEVFYGRIRKDPDESNAYWFWIVGDQLLKGAALNAWQIYQLKRSYETIHANARTACP